MADTGTANSTTSVTHGSIKKITVDMTSANPGEDFELAINTAIDGILLGILAMPTTGGTAPDNNYNITLEDAGQAGVDLLNGNGLLLAAVAAAGEYRGVDLDTGQGVPVRANSVILKGADMGVDNRTVITIYWR
jgi:hypothetical protein